MRLDHYEEAKQLLVAALDMRRRYMNISEQFFCKTTARMLDNELPPSSEFCIPADLQGTTRVTPAGDVISSKCCMQVSTYPVLHLKFGEEVSFLLHAPERMGVKPCDVV